MKNPAYLLKVDGVEIKSEERAVLIRLECELTSRMEAGYLYLEGICNPGEAEGKKWLDTFQVGVECQLSMGYGKKLQKIFRGFLYEITWKDPLEEGAMEVKALFLDARGRLMTSACADAGAVRTMSQMITAILTQNCCKSLTSRQNIDPVPKDWDLPIQRKNRSDYEVVCDAADFLCYEFYVCGEELYFVEPRKDTSPIVTFDTTVGMSLLEHSRTLADQCAAVVILGTDDQGERIQTRQARKKDSGFGGSRIGSVLSNDLCFSEQAVRTMAQAQYLAKARMAQRQSRMGKLRGGCMGVPELLPGKFLKVEKQSKPVCGTYYVQRVRHILDRNGYRTEFEAEE